MQADVDGMAASAMQSLVRDVVRAVEDAASGDSGDGDNEMNTDGPMTMDQSKIVRGVLRPL